MSDDDKARIIRDLQNFRRARTRLHPTLLAGAALGMKSAELAQHAGLSRQGVDRILRAARTAATPTPEESS